MYSLISKPVYNISPHNLNINLFLFIIKNKDEYSKFLNSDNTKILEILSANLSKFYNKKVHFDLIRISKPYLETNILANFIARYCELRSKTFRRVTNKIFSFSRIKNTKFQNFESNGIIPNFLTGINIKLAGRLYGQNIVPRRTVKITQRGSLTRSNTDFISKSRFTGINKRGTFSITTTIGQKFHI